MKKELHHRFIENLNHFEEWKDLIENKYYDCRTQVESDFCRSKKTILRATVLKDGEYQRFRYFQN